MGWERNVKILPAFSKGRYVPVGRCPAAGLRCHFGRCWASATGRQHPRRQPRPAATAFPYFPKKGGRMSPSWGGTAPGVFACGRGGQGASATAPAATAFGPAARTQRLYAASRGDSLKNCLYQIKKAYTVHTRRLLSALPFLWSSSSFISFSVWKNFWAFSPKNSSLTML